MIFIMMTGKWPLKWNMDITTGISDLKVIKGSPTSLDRSGIDQSQNLTGLLFRQDGNNVQHPMGVLL